MKLKRFTKPINHLQMNKELIKEFQENPEKLVEFLKNFKIETLVKSLKDILFNYCKENIQSRSLVFVLETDDNIVGGVGGVSRNLINSLLNVASDYPELEEIIQKTAIFMNTDEWHKQSENIFKVEPNKLKS